VVKALELMERSRSVVCFTGCTRATQTVFDEDQMFSWLACETKWAGGKTRGGEERGVEI
jgi:hypothetical protein